MSPALTAIGTPCSRASWQATAQVAFVFDVVVHQERVVQHLDGGGGRQRVGGVTTECPAGGKAERRSDAFSRARQVRRQQSVKVALRLSLRHRRLQPGEGRFAII